MVSRLERIEQTRRKILPVLKNYNVIRAGIFGSYSRGDSKKGSDVDLLVKIKEKISLLDFVGLKLELEDMLGRKVDLVEYGAIKPILKDKILKEEIQIL